jgi:ankyrin repeat protein
MIAAYYGSQKDEKIAEHMISLGANVNATNDARPNNTALLIAIWKNNINFAKLLIDNGAILNMSSVTGKKERSACEAAMIYGRVGIIPYIEGCCALISKKTDLMAITECK